MEDLVLSGKWMGLGERKEGRKGELWLVYKMAEWKSLWLCSSACAALGNNRVDSPEYEDRTKPGRKF